MELPFGPTSRKQEMMLNSQAKITIVGGAAGCVDGETEFLSPTGWKKISEWSDDEVMQFHLEDETCSFTTPLEYIKKPSEGFYHLKTDRGLNLRLSKEHRVLYRTSKGNLRFKPAEDFFKQHESSTLGNKSKILTTYSYSGHSLGLEESTIRLRVALKADGSLATESTGRYVVRLKKERKIVRFKELLESVGVDYSEYHEDSTGFVVFTLKQPECTKSLSEWMLCSAEDAHVIIDELKYWDSYYQPKGNRLSSFYTTDKEEADAVQYFFNICGFKASIVSDDRVGQSQGKYTRKSITYQVTPTKQTELNLQRKQGNKLEVPYIESEDFKYCFTVPSGALVLRREGCVFITGNSGKSYMMTMHPLQYVGDPNFDAIFFRRNTQQISGQGGLFDTARDMYGQLPDEIKPRFREKDYKALFPTGATIKFNHFEHESTRFEFQGLQFSAVYFDEGKRVPPQAVMLVE